jgi:serine/threonine protein kinase
MEVEVRTSREDALLGRGPGSPPRTLGRYRVVTELGRGSTSIVYLGAVDGPAGFNKLFALKLLRPALASDPALVAMFLAEARVGAHLNHPNVVSTLEIDETGPLPFIVMEYLDGQTLQRLVATARTAFKPLPLHMHLAAISGALEGLGHAHAATGPDGNSLQIVHRDFSPHNVFVTSSGAPKLLDFGCAQSVGAVSVMPTSAGHAAYMSPEQVSSEAVDARADLYAAGVMVWEAVTRKRFWPDEASKADILQALAARQLPEARVVALGHAPDDLRDLILKATAPHPSDRYQSASALQEDLQKTLRRITPPTFDLRDLGHRLTTVFATERVRMQAIINGAQESAAEGGARSPSSRPEHAGAGELSSRAHPGNDAAGVESRGAATGHPVPAAPSGPLPSFPVPTADRGGWLAFRRPGTLAAIAASLIVGAGLSAMRSRGDDRSPASTPVAPAETASAARAVQTLPASAPLEPSADPVPSAVAEPIPPAIPGPVPVESLPRSPGPLVVRRRAAGPPMTVHVESSPPPPEPSAAGGKRAAVEEPVVVSGSNSGGARPSHPIDSVNPYGP